VFFFFLFRDRPSTPERDQSSIRERHRQHLLQMTDPDHRRNRSHNRISLTTSEEGFPQPVFTPAVHIQHSNMGGNDPFLDRAAATSIVHSGLSAIHTSEAILPSSSSGIVHSGPPAIYMPDVVHSGPPVIHVPEAILASSSGGIVHSGPPAIHIPEVVLPPGWDAPLRHPIPVNIPPAPVLPQGRGRGHGRSSIQPMHVINSNISNPAVDGLHRGQIALRERERNFRNNQFATYRDEQMAQNEQRLADQRARVAEAQETLILEQIHQAQANTQAQINLQAIRAEREQRDAEAGARFLELYRNRQQRNVEEDERLAEERYQEQCHLSEERRRERHVEIRNLSHSSQNDVQLEELLRVDRVEREREDQEAARRQFEREAAEFELQRNADNLNRLEADDVDDVPLPQENVPIGRRPYSDPLTRHSLGPMNIECSHCHALHFDSEKLSGSTINNKKFGGCCLQGQVKLPAFPPPPATLRDLLCGINPLSNTFKKNIRQYNAAFAFTSLGVKIDSSVTGVPGGPFSFRINGGLYHKMGSLLPENNTPPKYAQLYVHDGFMDNRLRNNPNLDVTIMTQLQAMLHQTHPYVRLFKHAYQIMAALPPEQQGNVQVKLHVEQSADKRRYNLPTEEEIAVIVPGDGSEDVRSDRDIIVRLIGGSLQRISHLHPSYSSLHYVLLFPHGEDGWSNAIPAHPGPSGRVRSANVSQRCYYAYRLHARPGEQPLLLRGGNLLQQYIVDAWASTEQSALNWVRHNQKELRADVYQGLRDAAANGDNNLENVGEKIILPSTHIGSPRNMQQLFQDSMAICRFFRKPDIFLTMTANPAWPEITEQLLRDDPVPGQQQSKQTAADRPDIVARVFEEKKKALLKEIKDGLFGKAVAMVHTIEFQKRGLPHMHLLIFLDQNDKIRNPDHVDSIVSAQIPDKTLHPKLWETVTTTMIHQCTDKCKVNGKCSKGFPKEFRDHTQFGENGYPDYARPNNGVNVTKQGKTYDNRHVVPYNPFLSAKYNCHINVEICASVEAVKYIHKYIYKGHDRTTIEVSAAQEGAGRDEIKEYIDSRYVSAIEGCWHLFEYNMHAEQPSVYRLPVHLPDQNLVYFNPDDDLNDVLDRDASRKTPLTAFFEANAQNKADPTKMVKAQETLYQNFPQHFVYVKTQKQWKVRERHKESPPIGRMYFATPSAGERFYLRTLLTVVKGPTSFEDLRTFEGERYETFREACLARGLLENDNEWIKCLQEAGDMQTGSALRSLFATILLHCNPSAPAALWDQFKVKICDDLERRLQREHPNDIITTEMTYDYGLHLVDKILKASGKSLKDFPPMPEPHRQWEDVCNNYLLWEQLNYDRQELAARVAQQYQQFNNEQRILYDDVIDSVNNKKGEIFFVHSAGGGGKTFVCNTIAAAVRKEESIALCVASSGIASLLLEGGRTAHSRFKIPLQINESSKCKIKRGSDLHKVLEKTGIVIWDEVPMQHKHVVEANDRTLQEVLKPTDNNDWNKYFGGITVLFGGDFRQTLPVIPKGTRQEVVSASICRSNLWSNVKVHYLKQNMRLERSAESDAFASWLLKVGSGEENDRDGKITLPPQMRCGDNVQALIDSTYPGIHNGNFLDQYFLDRTILCARNDDVDELNAEILRQFPGAEHVCNSADSVITENEASGFQPYPTEFLNSLTASGLPLSHLSLKVGSPLMLLRNLDPLQGLCNGTRLILVKIQRHVLECRIISGDQRFSGKHVLIPRLILEPNNESLPIPLRRRQFPVRLAFAMTINKSQGQSVKHVGLDLRTSVFSHGQLYVALSRCTSGNRIKVLLPPDQEDMRTANIVYKEALRFIQCMCILLVFY
jgi:hypothetical protein